MLWTHLKHQAGSKRRSGTPGYSVRQQHRMKPINTPEVLVRRVADHLTLTQENTDRDVCCLWSCWGQNQLQ